MKSENGKETNGWNAQAEMETQNIEADKSSERERISGNKIKKQKIEGKKDLEQKTGQQELHCKRCVPENGRQRKVGRAGINQRKWLLIWLVISLIYLVTVCAAGVLSKDAALVTDFSRKNLAPCIQYPFGTDWMGRDMFVRTLCGLSLSILIGCLAATVSAVIAFLVGVACATLGKAVDTALTWLIDLIMGVPHMLLLILICVATGRGLRGVIIGVALSHWTSLARLIRGEVLQLKEQKYIQTAQRLGKGRLYIAMKHMAPQLLPQLIVGLVLLFPHAILHESGITFLGFGLSNEQPAIGIILSEAMRYLITGKWWLAVFPGAMLVITVVCFFVAGESLRKLLDPSSAHD